MSTDVSEVHAASITTLMMEAACASETSVDFQLRTWQYIPEDSERHTRRRENLKSHTSEIIVTQMGKHNKSVMVAMYGTPCASNNSVSMLV
jgi:hypothetical protein